MRMQSLLLASLLLGLYGCQPEAPVQQETAAVPAAVPEVVASAVAPVAEPVATAEAVAAKSVELPVVQEKPAVVKEKSAVVKEKPVVVKEKPQAQVVQAVAEAPAPVAAEPAVPAAKVVAAVSEADALALAKKNNCLTCHAIGKKVVGPSWKDVAAKYRGDSTAEAHLVNKIAAGGSGVWGSMKMPAQPQISEADRTMLARFVLNLK